MADDHVKIRFEVEAASPGSVEVESLWAQPSDDGYKIDNVPFYVREIALGDVVSVSTESDGTLRFTALVRPSGHSTVRLWFQDPSDVQAIRNELRTYGCESELSELPRLVAVDIPPSVPYAKVRARLEEGEASGVFEYQEACLGFPETS